MTARVPSLHEHPLRHELAQEVHARPHEELQRPVRVSHLAVTGGAAEAERAAITDLCHRVGAPVPAPFANYLSVDLGRFRLRWERHSEFSTYTFFRIEPADTFLRVEPVDTFLRVEPFDDPFASPALAVVPAEWLDGLPGQVLTALHLAVVVGDDGELPDLSPWFGGSQPAVGSRVNGGAGAAWTDFRLHEGFGRILVRDSHLTRGQTGRLVQRLLEIETYRMMALLALPVARELAPHLERIEAGVAAIVAELAHGEGEGEGGGDARVLLGRLTQLAAEAEGLAAETGYRFSAARAYHAIVHRRIEALREQRIAGTQTVAEFMERRLAPAMLTCESTAERMEVLSRHLARAGDLLRTRVDIALEENNRDLLRSMDRRAHMQLRLQETVEGLSVVAISYYLLSLLGYAAKGAHAVGLAVDSDIVKLVGMPLVIALVAISVRRLRRAVGRQQE
ncbi:MAG: DUF3422 domain-containing protein [Alphaproteobacteria bacterium]